MLSFTVVVVHDARVDLSDGNIAIDDAAATYRLFLRFRADLTINVLKDDLNLKGVALQFA